MLCACVRGVRFKKQTNCTETRYGNIIREHIESNNAKNGDKLNNIVNIFRQFFASNPSTALYRVRRFIIAMEKKHTHFFLVK